MRDLDTKPCVRSTRKTPTSHREYNALDLKKYMDTSVQALTSDHPDAKRSYVYIRVYPSDFDDLFERQEKAFAHHYPHHTIVKEYGSAFFSRPSLIGLIKRALQGLVGEIVVNCRFRFSSDFFTATPTYSTTLAHASWSTTWCQSRNSPKNRHWTPTARASSTTRASPNTTHLRNADLGGRGSTSVQPFSFMAAPGGTNTPPCT